MSRHWAVILLLAVILQPCVAQELASVEAHADVTVISLGDRVTLTILVQHATSETVSWPELADTLGSFEVRRSSDEPTVAIDGRQTSTRRYELTTFELGELEIPSVEIAIADSGDSEPRILSTEPIPVVVQSVGIDESGDIRTVKAPLEIPRNWLLLLPWVLLCCGGAVLSYWMYRRYRARKRVHQQYVIPAAPPRPPHEIAYEALDRLEAKRLLDRGEIKQYYIEVSEIIRAYIEGRYPIDALEMTSYEVLQELRKTGIDPEVYDLFPPFLGRADLVKFAKHRPGPETSKEMIPLARLLVDETRAPDRTPESEPSTERSEVAVAEDRVEVN